MQVMSTVDAAKKLQVSSDTVLGLIKSNQLPASRLSERGNWRIRREDLEIFAQERGIELLETEPKK